MAFSVLQIVIDVYDEEMKSKLAADYKNLLAHQSASIRS